MKKLFIIFLFLFSFSSYAENIKHVIEFSVNTCDIIYNNKYKSFINDLIVYKDIDSVLIIGCASPEGSVIKNIELAEQRANVTSSFINIPENKIIINNNYDLFIEKTGYINPSFEMLRAAYIEIKLKENLKPINDTIKIIDTIQIIDTVKVIDTIRINNKNIVDFSIYNNLVFDLLLTKNIGIEWYFKQWSYFIDVSKNNNITIWHTGIKKYFNEEYKKWFVGIYGDFGYVSNNPFFGCGIASGYKINLINNWKIYPEIRIGYNKIDFNKQRKINLFYVSNEQTTNKEISKITAFCPTYIALTIQKDFNIND